MQKYIYLIINIFKEKHCYVNMHGQYQKNQYCPVSKGILEK